VTVAAESVNAGLDCMLTESTTDDETLTASMFELTLACLYC